MLDEPHPGGAHLAWKRHHNWTLYAQLNIIITHPSSLNNYPLQISLDKKQLGMYNPNELSSLPYHGVGNGLPFTLIVDTGDLLSTRLVT